MQSGERSMEKRYFTDYSYYVGKAQKMCKTAGALHIFASAQWQPLQWPQFPLQPLPFFLSLYSERAASAAITSTIPPMIRFPTIEGIYCPSLLF